MTAALRFDPIRLPPECVKLRKEVRAFLAEEISAGTFSPFKPNREDTDAPEFSRKVGAKGWLGMTWPKKYGGHERSFLERYVVTEEMRVANAPTRRFFVADRQSGPVLLKYAPENIKMDILPRICRGEVAFVLAANRSEPEFGSLIPMEKHSSPRQIRGRMSVLMFSGAYFSSTGPLCRSATKNRRVGALATRISSVTT